MALDIPLPTASPYDDPSQYIPLALSAIEGFLLSRDVWEPDEYEAARQYMQDFMSYIVDLMGSDALGRPIGYVVMWPTGVAPAGWLLCNGDAALIATYARLFDVIGTTYGGTDGTYFQLPDFRDRSPMMPGYEVITALADEAGEFEAELSIANLPAHDHNYADPGHIHTLTDPGHIHTLTDPGHFHLQDVGGADAYLATGGSGRSGYGAVVTASTTRVQTDNATTGASVASHSTGASVASHNTGITFVGQGSDTPHPNLHPVFGINFIIYAGV